MTGGDRADVEVFFANTGKTSLRLIFERSQRPKGGTKDAGRDQDGARLHVYPLSAPGGPLDVPSSMIGELREAPAETAVVTLASGGWARAIGELSATGYVDDPKTALGERLAPLAPGTYRLGVSTLLAFGPPPVDASVQVH
jgi:hypothetical protein